MPEKIDVVLKVKLDENGVENLQKKLRSYNLGKEFNYAVAVLNLSIADGKSETKENLEIKIVPKVQYITPFITKELAENYMEELSTIGKLMIFLPVDEKGRAVLREDNINNTLKEINFKKSMNFEDDFPMEKQLILFAYRWNALDEEEKNIYFTRLFKIEEKEYFESILKEVYSKFNLKY